jgi:predicted amidohydrolase YtcJ
MSTLLLRQAEVEGERVDVRVEGDRIATVTPPGSASGADVEVECGGGALLPGLHDHHLHLLSMAASGDSLDVSSQLDQRIRDAHARALPGAAIRAVLYDDVGEGPLDRWRLDALAPGRAVRVQHRTGALWVLSTAALEQAGVRDDAEGGDDTGPSDHGAPDIERDRGGRPTGRLFRSDAWLQERLPVGDRTDRTDLTAVGLRLASFGVTGVTDCTPTVAVEYFETLARAVRNGTLPLTVAITGGPQLSDLVPPPPLERGPVKILVTDHALPAFDDLRTWVTRAHRSGRPVAVHCVTRAALLLALAVWHEVGSVAGDRIEHASVTPPEVIAAMAGLSLTVVTQPAFIAARGDAYLSEVDPADRPDLYRCASLLAGGVAVGGSTDAPFGPDDPWIAMQAARERRAPSGRPVGSDRGLGPAAALQLFLGPLEHPGGPARRISPGTPADLCLLDVPLHMALRDPSSRHVALTIAGGERTFTA